MELKLLGNHLESISIKATNLCNLKCKLCFLTSRSKKKIFPPDGAVYHLSLNTFKRLINQLRRFDNYENVVVNLSGGEPFLNPNILEILEIANKYNIKLKIFTNGVLLGDKFLNKIKKNPPFGLMFSIDGLRQEHEANRGKNSFNKALSSIKKIQQIKKKHFLSFPLLTINTVISKLNLNSFEKMIPLAQRLGCNILSYSLVQWSDQLVIDKCKSEFRKRFGVYSKGAKIMESISHGLGKLDKAEIRQIINKIKLIRQNSKVGNLKIFFFPDFENEEEIINWFSKGCYKIDNCSNIFKQIRVNYRGDIFPACSVPFYKFGNINKEPLYKILTGNRVKQLSKEIKDNGFFYVCQRCCRRPSQSSVLKKLNNLD